MEDYRTIHGTATGEDEEKKSRFIAALSFADSEEAAVAFLEHRGTQPRGGQARSHDAGPGKRHRHPLQLPHPEPARCLP